MTASFQLARVGSRFSAAFEKQLGLKLEPRKIAFDAFVIDHAEKAPIENQLLSGAKFGFRAQNRSLTVAALIGSLIVSTKPSEPRP
jgi:hypothetical protein